MLKQPRLLFTNIILALYKAATDTIKHEGIEYSGYLAFLLILSIFPYIFLLTTLGSAFSSSFNFNMVTDDLMNLLYLNIPSDITQGLLPYIQEISYGPPQSLLNFVIVGAAWTSSSSVEGIRNILNKAYRVKTPPPYLLGRLISILEFFLITLAIIFTAVCLTITPFLAVHFKLFINITPTTLLYSRYIFSITILLLAVCLLYIIIPNLKQRWAAVIPGGILVVILWVISANMFSFYIKTFANMNLIYGSLAGIIIALLFFYIISLCFIYGAEFNYNLNKLNNKKVELSF